MSKEFDYCLKFIIIGDSGCGKSCIMRQFLDNECMYEYLNLNLLN